MKIIFDQDLVEQIIYFLCLGCYENIMDEFGDNNPDCHFYDISGPLKFELFDPKCCDCEEELTKDDYLVTARGKQTVTNMNRMYEEWHRDGYCYIPEQHTGIRIDI